MGFSQSALALLGLQRLGAHVIFTPH